MITFPVKTNRENAAVSPLFGKAKYFAFYDGENISIEANPYSNGAAIVDWFKQKGVENLIIKEMGVNPYKKLKQTNINIFYAGDKRIEISELIKEFEENKLEKLNEEKILEIIKKHEKSHSHSHSH